MSRPAAEDGIQDGRGRSPWSAEILTLYPEMFPGPLWHSLAGRALDRGLWKLGVTQLRDYGFGRYRAVDDTPSGGGPGMVMRADVLAPAIDATIKKYPGHALIYLTPRGQPLNQSRIKRLATESGVIVLCGRFEGVDQRLIEARPFEEICLGDFILSGGELAALVMIDACVRLLPGVMGDHASQAEESFEDDLLEYPHYTRPDIWEGRAVPEVLTSGHHERIRAWRQDRAEVVTRERRTDLWVRREVRRRGSGGLT